MPVNRLSLLGALAILTFGALPVSAHERMEASDVPTVPPSSKLHNLVLYADARLAFYAAEAPRSSCRSRAAESESDAETAHAEE